MSNKALVSEKMEAKARLHDLIINIDSPRQSILNAYKLKSELKKQRDQELEELKKSQIIKTLDPVPLTPQSKFSHIPGLTMRTGGKSSSNLHSTSRKAL